MKWLLDAFLLALVVGVLVWGWRDDRAAEPEVDAYERIRKELAKLGGEPSFRQVRVAADDRPRPMLGIVVSPIFRDVAGDDYCYVEWGPKRVRYLERVDELAPYGRNEASR